MRDEHPPEGESEPIATQLPASWTKHPPGRRQILRFVRSVFVKDRLPSEEEGWLVEQLGDFLHRSTLTRRQFLARTAVGSLAVIVEGDNLLATATRGDGLTRLLPLPEGALAASLAAPTLTADLLRPQDMLALRFEFFNLDLAGGSLVRQVAAEDAFVVVHLAHGQKLSAAGALVADHVPQNIAEEAFFDPGADPDPPGAIDASLAGPSRLAFKVPTTVSSIPFTLPGLLDWAGFQQSVPPAALPPGATPATPPTIREPLNTETNIEAPWHLILSPHAGAGWAHAPRPVTREGRTELWHTRLGVNKSGVIDETDAAQRTVRAVWTEPTFNPANPSGSPDPAFFPRVSLEADDRWQLVKLSSDFSLLSPTGATVPARPVDVNRLMLTALGAWMDVRGNWPPPPVHGTWPEPPSDTLSLTEWRHIATMGRDHYVKVVHLGYLFPFGHPAVVIIITERKFQPVPSGGGALAGKPAAYLRKREFIVVRQPLVTYPGASPQPDEGRGMPFKSVRITTLVTPDLDAPAIIDAVGTAAQAFWPRVGSNDFLFHLIGEDTDGQRIEFAAPLAFIRADIAGLLLPNMTNLRNYYNGLPLTDSRRQRPLNGQRVAMARSSKSQGLAGGKPGDTSVEVNTMTFGATLPIAFDPNKDQPRYFPVWSEAAVRLNGVEQVRGGPLPTPSVLRPFEAFLSGGFTNNPGQIFAELKGGVELSFSTPGSGASDKSGGVITPNMSINALSRTLGPFGGQINPVPQMFNPVSFFKFDAKILGGIFLSDIINGVGFGDLTKVPKTTTRTIYPENDQNKPPRAIETHMSFQPMLKADPLGIFDPDGASMTVDATFLTPLDPPGEPTFQIVGDLRSFRITMLGRDAKFLVLQFNRLTFTAGKNKKPNVDVDINGVQFAGPLSFVNSLKDLLKTGGTGPNVEISLNPPQVTAGVTLAVPTIGVGVLTIQNLAFSAGLTIPFTGNPARVRFAFSERERPFLLTVYGLGGGGFFGIAIGMDGVEILEAALEFGASLALDLGVISGEVHVMGGIYYKMMVNPPGPPPPAAEENIELTAYIRMGGSVDVLGLITASIEFYLGMRYEFTPNELWGQARLTIEVEILFFSASVSVSIERRLAGGGGNREISSPAELEIASIGPGPTQRGASPTQNFADLIAQPDWNEYAAAFATIR